MLRSSFFDFGLTALLVFLSFRRFIYRERKKWLFSFFDHAWSAHTFYRSFSMFVFGRRKRNKKSKLVGDLFP